MIEWKLPIKTISESNNFEHWTKKHKRHTSQKLHIIWQFKGLGEWKFELPITVKLTRIAPRKLDSDNLQMAFKWIRDAVAENLTGCKIAGRADDDERIIWQYAQAKGLPKEYAVRISFI